MGGSMKIFRMPGKRESGFTLIELMTTIAVFSVLATIAIPTFMSWLPGMRLNGAARQVMGDLMAARMNAVKLNKNTQVFFDGNYQYKICNDTDDLGTTVSYEEGDLVTKNIQDNYPGVQIISATNNPIFLPRGTVTNLATIKLQNSSGTKAITVSIAGRVKIN